MTPVSDWETPVLISDPIIQRFATKLHKVPHKFRLKFTIFAVQFEIGLQMENRVQNYEIPSPQCVTTVHMGQ
jgi:hypothetical protein